MPDQTRSDQTRSDQTRSDQTRSEQTRSEQAQPERTIPLDGTATEVVPADDTPTLRLDGQSSPGPEPRWIGSAPIPSTRPSSTHQPRGRRLHDTLDLPAVELDGPAGPAGPAPGTPAPPAPSRPRRLRGFRGRPRSTAPGYGPPGPPPGYPPVGYPPAGPPPPYPPPPPGYRRARRGAVPWRRRRRRWPWVLLTMFALCAGCCGWVVRTVQPYVEQYPASISSTREVTGLVRIEDGAGRAGAKPLLTKIRSLIDQGSFTELYRDAADRRRTVTVFGVTRFVVKPAKDLDDAFGQLGPDLALTGVHEVEPGPLGGAARCGSGTRSRQPVVVCGWADHGSLAVALFSERPEDEATVLMQTLRTTLITR